MGAAINHSINQTLNQEENSFSGVFDIPGVAGAVLQTALLFINLIMTRAKPAGKIYQTFTNFFLKIAKIGINGHEKRSILTIHNFQQKTA